MLVLFRYVTLNSKPNSFFSSFSYPFIHFEQNKNSSSECIWVDSRIVTLFISIFKTTDSHLLLMSFICFCRWASSPIWLYGSHLSLGQNQKWWSKVVQLHGLIWVIQMQASPRLNRYGFYFYNDSLNPLCNILAGWTQYLALLFFAGHCKTYVWCIWQGQ